MTPAEEEWFEVALVKLRLTHDPVFAQWAQLMRGRDHPQVIPCMKFWLGEGPLPPV